MMTTIFDRKKFFYGAIILLILIRWANTYQLQSNRQIPIEADDSFSYIFHAKALDYIKPNETKFFQSFENLSEMKLEQNSWPEFYKKRLYHRIKRFYHLGHAVYLNVLNKLTQTNYVQTYWISIYLLGMFLIALPVLFARKIFDAGTAIMSGAFILFNYLAVHHQMMGAPREWANLFYFSLYMLWIAKLSDRTFLLSTAAMIIPFASFHPIGKPLCFVYLIFSLAMSFSRDYRRKAIYAISLSLLAIASYYALYYIFEVTNKRLSYSIEFLFLEGLKSILSSFFPFFGEDLKLKEALIQILLVYPPTIGLLYFLKTKDYLKALITVFLVGPHLGFHFFQFEYMPALSHYPLREYLNTSTLIFSSLIASHLIVKYMLEKAWWQQFQEKRKWAFPVILCVLILGIQFSPYPKKFHRFHGSRHNFSDPVKFIAAVDQKIAHDDCIVFRSEFLLYSYLTFTKVDRDVALVLNIKDKIYNYSKNDYRACKSHLFFKGSKTRPLFELGDYALYDRYEVE